MESTEPASQMTSKVSKFVNCHQLQCNINTTTCTTGAYDLRYINMMMKLQLSTTKQFCNYIREVYVAVPHSCNSAANSDTIELRTTAGSPQLLKTSTSCLKTPAFQTYLTDDLHTQPFRQSRNIQAASNDQCAASQRKKTVHFVKPFSVHCDEAAKSRSPQSHEKDFLDYDYVNNGVLRNDRKYRDHHTRNRQIEALRKASQSRQQLQSATRGPTERQSGHSRQVINLSQYLHDRHKDSDVESQGGFSDGDTTTSGSYCMDDEDLAHDVLV